MTPARSAAPGSPSIPSSGTRTPVNVTDGLNVARALVEVAPLLRGRSKGVDEPHDRGMHVKGHAGIRAAAGHGANEGDVRGHVEPEPAVRGRHGAGEQALAPEGPPALDRVGAGDVVLARPRGERLAG